MKPTPSRAQSIADEIARQIEQGRIVTGSRLPSVRTAAGLYGVSKNTVVDAYDRLVATGFVEPRRGSGFYATPLPSHNRHRKPRHFTEAIDLVSLLREQLNQHYQVRAGDGRPPLEWIAASELSRYLRHGSQINKDTESFEYGRPEGFTPLREMIARQLADRAIDVYIDQVLLTFGANHAFDLIIRHFVEPGDTVLVESPGYYPLFGKLRLANANIVGISRRADGPDLEVLARQARRYQPRLMFVQPSAHNPTGGSMTLAAMHRLLRVAEQHDLNLVEDHAFADILPRTTPRLAALDALERVIYVGTVSKTLSAALRSGYIVARPDWIASLTDIKMLTVVNTSGTTERMLYDMIRRGLYRRHLTRLQDRVAQATADTLSRMSTLGFGDIEPPTGGFFMWCPLPNGMDDLELARQASAEGIFLAPSSLFCPAPETVPAALRINIAYGSDPQLLSFLGKQLAGR